MTVRDAYADTARVTRYYDLLLRGGTRRRIPELAGNCREDHLLEESPIPGTDGPVLPSTVTTACHGADAVPVDREDSWPPESFGRALASRVEGSRSVSYDGAGHVPMEETPEASTAHAAAFLSET